MAQLHMVRHSHEVNRAFKRHVDAMFVHDTVAGARGLATLAVVLTPGNRAAGGGGGPDSPELEPLSSQDESYTLTVPGDAALGSGPGTQLQIRAASVCGVVRALQTLAQLVAFDYAAGAYVVRAAPWNISDAPRFAHRGLLVDTGRHFLPVLSIRRVIETMALVKLNVLHWHMYDFQSFPLEIKSPTLRGLWNASFSEAERYSRGDVRHIVRFAKARGVRVMVELDMPGHASSWCEA